MQGTPLQHAQVAPSRQIPAHCMLALNSPANLEHTHASCGTQSMQTCSVAATPPAPRCTVLTTLPCPTLPYRAPPSARR